MQRKDRVDAFGATILIAFSMLLGLNQVMVKVVNSGLQPVFQAGLRSACAFLPVLAYALLTRRRLSVSDGSLLPGLVSGLFFSIEFILLFQALDYTTVSRVSILFYTMPFWVAIGAHFLIPGERLTPVRVAGLVLAVVGVSLAFTDKAAPATERALLGDVLCLVAAACWAAIALLVRATRLSKSTPEMQLLYQLTVSAVVMIAVAPLFGDFTRDLTPTIWGIFAAQVIFVVCIGFLTWFWVLSIYPASDMATFSFLAPVFGVLFGWLLLGEAISWSIIASLALVGTGIVLVNRRPRGKPAHA
jgi:drug/metabolite transporter (DMT)-like permease